MALRIAQRARILAIAFFASVAILGGMLPVRADEATARTAASAKRATSFTPTELPAVMPAGPASRGATSFANGFLYYPGTQSGGVNVGGRVPVGKSHVYVPYYGNVSGDPTHPNVQGTTGIAYGFRTWDISVLNSGTSNSQQTLPGVDPPKTNPALSLSIRF